MQMRFADGYTDKPQGARAVLVERIRCLRMQSWADPGDRELKLEVEKAEDELRRFDGAAWGKPQ
jgi:hypothetical protein